MTKQFLVSWTGSEDLGVYEAVDEHSAILAAVQDAGYSSLEDAGEFIYDEAGDLTLQATRVNH